MITEADIYTAEQIDELQQLEVNFNTFRENLLVTESAMHPWILNVVLYSSFTYEVIMVASSFLAKSIPVFLSLGLFTTRKPEFCRALIMYLAAKTVFYFWNDGSFILSPEKYYICDLDGKLLENVGLNE